MIPHPAKLHHIAYLNRLLTEGRATKLTVDAAHSAWNTARNAAGSTLPIPASVVGEGGEIHYAWDNSPHYMEAEIFPDGRIEWVYVDRETGATWFSDEFGFSAPPVEFEAKISLMCNCPV